MAKKDIAVARETTLPAPADTPANATSLQIQLPPDSAPRVARGGDVQVWMPPERAGGVRAFGELRPGTVYAVDAPEALRLVTVKGFRFASITAHQAVSDHIDGIADAVSTTPQE